MNKIADSTSQAPKITGMLIDFEVFEVSEILEFLENEELLKERVKEAEELIENTAETANENTIQWLSYITKIYSTYYLLMSDNPPLLFLSPLQYIFMCPIIGVDDLIHSFPKVPATNTNLIIIIYIINLACL